jgi:transposase
MNAILFWFSDEQWARIEPHLPTNQPGPDRKGDRRFLSGIMHVQRIGCRWKDCPSEYGPAKTIYNRFALWSERAFGRRYSPRSPGSPTHLGMWHLTAAM